MDREKEELKVRLLDGTEATVQVYKYINMTEKMRLLTNNSSRGKFRDGKSEFEIDIFNIMEQYLKVVWCDETYKMDDVDTTSIEKYVMDKIQNFLPKMEGTK
jgi:uncharacterized protein YkuJ